jgi:MYXO-CTERM domain-containing protein
MKPTSWPQMLGALALAGVAAAPVHAEMINFESIAPGTILFPGDGVMQQGFSITTQFSPAVVDTSAAFGPGVGLDLAGPSGNATQFYIGLNDGVARLRASNGRVFRVAGFDYGFVSALTNLFNPGDVPGLLVADYVTSAGGTGFELFSFGAADVNGDFAFRSAGAAEMGALGMGVTQVDFFACTADANGNCAAVNVNFSQFALDNVSVIPNPASLALAALGLGLLAATRRRS